MKLEFLQINLLHVFVIGVIFVYIGYNKEETPYWIYNILYVLAVLIVLLIDIRNINVTNLTHLNKRNIIKIVHLVVILPLILYVAYTRTLSPMMYDSLLWIGVVVILYHAYRSFTRYQSLQEAKLENFSGKIDN